MLRLEKYFYYTICLLLISLQSISQNKIAIEVTNTWHNHLIGDNLLTPEKRSTWTSAPFRLKDKPLLPAGIVGEVVLKIN